MDAERLERLRRLARHGGDIGATLEVLRHSERCGWSDAPLLDFGDCDRMADRMALNCLRTAGLWGVTVEYETTIVKQKSLDAVALIGLGPMAQRVGWGLEPESIHASAWEMFWSQRARYRVEFTDETTGWLGYLWMLSEIQVVLVYVNGPIIKRLLPAYMSEVSDGHS